MKPIFLDLGLFCSVLARAIGRVCGPGQVWFLLDLLLVFWPPPPLRRAVAGVGLCLSHLGHLNRRFSVANTLVLNP